MTTTEIHPSMTGLESCFEEELAHADRKYVDPDLIKIGERPALKPAREGKESRLTEEAMLLQS